MVRLLKLLFAPAPVAAATDRDAETRRKAQVEACLTTGDSHGDKFFELYRMMVASSEALVARRQTVNTYFVTVNGLLATGTGLLLQRDVGTYLTALSLFILSTVGIVTSVVWRLVLISFGQLNRGKFAVINAMEASLPARIYEAEWEALGRGEDPTLYRSFTEREALVPAAILGLWLTVAVVFLCIAVVAG